MKIIFILSTTLLFCRFFKIQDSVYKYLIVGLYFFSGTMVILYFIGSSNFILYYVYYVFLSMLAYQDLKTYYLSLKWWIISLIMMLICGFDHHFISGFLFLFPALLIYVFCDDWIGNADLFYLFYFGSILGYERMIVAVMLAIFIGIIFAVLSKKRIVPFVSCLAIGTFVTLLRGYSIFMFIYDILYL